MGGSEYARQFLPGGLLEPPPPDLAAETSIIDSLLRGIEGGLVFSAHDVSHGGLLVTLAEMMAASAPFPCGCEIDLSGSLPSGARIDLYAFSEFGGIVVEVDPEKWSSFETELSRRKTPWVAIGRTAQAPVMSVRWESGRLDVALSEVENARHHRNRFNALFA
jgi:phosphoribosylformylglycinamidine synthase